MICDCISSNAHTEVRSVIKVLWLLDSTNVIFSLSMQCRMAHFLEMISLYSRIMPVLTSCMRLKFLEDVRIARMDWPAFSPDLSPIDQIRGMMERWVMVHCCCCFLQYHRTTVLSKIGCWVKVRRKGSESVSSSEISHLVVYRNFPVNLRADLRNALLEIWDSIPQEYISILIIQPSGGNVCYYITFVFVLIFWHFFTRSQNLFKLR